MLYQGRNFVIEDLSGPDAADVLCQTSLRPIIHWWIADDFYVDRAKGCWVEALKNVLEKEIRCDYWETPTPEEIIEALEALEQVNSKLITEGEMPEGPSSLEQNNNIHEFSRLHLTSTILLIICGLLLLILIMN